MANSESTLKESHGTLGDVPEETGVSSLGIRIGMIGTNFKIAQISAREQLARKITLEKLLRLRLDEMEGGPTEIVLLSTCNRIEVYYASEEMEKTADILSACFTLPQSTKRSEENFGTYEYSDGRAIEHLFEVAAGLDSLVIGEAQILAQVREASKIANERGLCGPLLAKLFSKAYDAGREIRESYPRFTNGFRNSVSLSVSDLISTHFEKKKPNILLIGSGKMI
ncbi:MAG TPA: hypothetical protein VJN71_02605, partial [Nitrososphaerales archaeon]|nr:hypothetical protein [Nitrososphaerales archaeon]